MLDADWMRRAVIKVKMYAVRDKQLVQLLSKMVPSKQFKAANKKQKNHSLREKNNKVASHLRPAWR